MTVYHGVLRTENFCHDNVNVKKYTNTSENEQLVALSQIQMQLRFDFFPRNMSPSIHTDILLE